MPPLVGIAIVFGASALGFTAAIAGTIAATLEVGTITAGIIGDVAAGAIVGAAAGAGTAVAAGTDVGNGALWGAATGGATAGLTPALADVSGLSTTTSQAIASGVVTTGAATAQGSPLTKALEYGAVAGAGNYAGSELFSSPGNEKGGSGGGSTPAPGATPGVESTTITGQTGPYTDVGGALAGRGGNNAPESVTVSANQPSAPILPSSSQYGTESVTIKPDNANSSPSILDQIQQSPSTQGAEKGALTTALFSLLFPTGGGQYSGGGSASTSPAAGGGTVGIGSAGGPGGAGGPAASAAAGQSGQVGSTSGYAPGSPILNSPEGATKYSPWNVESLRTAPGTS